MNKAERERFIAELEGMARRLRSDEPFTKAFRTDIRKFGRRLAKIDTLQGSARLKAFAKLQSEQEEMLARWQAEGSTSPILNDPIATDSFSTRLENSLLNANVQTYGEVRLRRQNDLLKVKGLGLGTLAELRDHLRERNLSLRPDL